jgi:voltage-gated potassium channel
MKDHVVVCGYGRIGRRVVDDLRNNGETCVVIEKDPVKIETLKSLFVPCVTGDATDPTALGAAAIDAARVLVVALPEFGPSMLVTLLARKSNDRVRIIARCDEDIDHQGLIVAGANQVVSPLELVAERMALSAIDPNALGYVQIDGSDGHWLRVDQLHVKEGCILCDHSVSDNPAFSEFDLLLVGIRKATGQMLFKPRSSERFEAGDTLVVVGTPPKLVMLKQLMKQTLPGSASHAAVAVKARS